MMLIQHHWGKPSYLALLVAASLSAHPAQAQQPVEQQSAASAASAQNDYSDIERIEVKGYRWFPEAVSMEGRYELSREMLDQRAKGNGNITDMLLFLPGVQGSESRFDADLQGEIRSQQISISGAQPWQTGFFFDGLSNNSLIDPGAADLSPSAQDDVQGHPQAFFINEALVGSVSVYDSNVPARFSGFNGGVVDVQSRDLRQTPKFSLSLRGSESNWNQYRYIDNREFQDQPDPPGNQSQLDSPPNFSKRSMSLLASVEPWQDHQLVLALSHTLSEVGDVSLLQPVITERESTSASLKYQWLNGWVDRLSLTASYSPYTGRYILTDVLNSDYDIDGGGYQFSADIQQQLGAWDISSRLGYSFSENSRQAPNVYLPWIRAAGKSWGLYTGEVPYSQEGGYGDIKKEQQQLTWTLDASVDLGEALSAQQSLSLGMSQRQSDINQRRPETGLVYNSPFRDSELDCRGQSLDCIEQSYQIPLEQLAQQLGGSIDLSNPEHLQAYNDNLLTRGQFFRYRRVYPLADIDVSMYEASVYGEYGLKWARANLILGARADYNDFLERVDVAPRIRGGFDLWGDDSSLLFFGVNRYYASNLMTYKLREAKRPYITQLRTLQQGEVGDWYTSTETPRYRYRFDGTSTPYNDEFSLGWKQQIGDGVLSIKGVRRWQRDQFNRESTQEADGLTYIYLGNRGSGAYERLTVSYQYRWHEHEFWLHSSWSENLSSNESYDANIDAVPEDELVLLRYQDEQGEDQYSLMSQDDLTRRNADYSRPLDVNLSVHSRWNDWLSSVINVSYQGDYLSAVSTSNRREYERGDDICESCDVTALTYPVYVEARRPSRLMTDATLHIDTAIYQQPVRLTVEVNNLFNRRTYSVLDGQAGIETGRSFWLGIQMSWD